MVYGNSRVGSGRVDADLRRVAHGDVRALVYVIARAHVGRVEEEAGAARAGEVGTHHGALLLASGTRQAEVLDALVVGVARVARRTGTALVTSRRQIGAVDERRAGCRRCQATGCHRLVAQGARESGRALARCQLNSCKSLLTLSVFSGLYCTKAFS